MPLPTFVIVGAQKSGTTTLHDLLGQHPQVWVSDPKELHYFDKRHARGLEWYAEQFTPSAGEQAWGESTPFYLYKDRARRVMVDSLPDAVFVAVLREPVARAYSHYWFSRSKQVEPIASFSEAIAAEPARLAAKPDGQPARGSYLDRGRYLRQLKDLTDRVGRDRLLVHLTDDLRTDALGVLRRTCRFLGVDEESVSDIEVRDLNSYAHRTVNSESGAALPSGVAETGALPAGSYPPIDPSVDRDLREVFRSENERLAEWLGRDLSAWM